MIVAGVMVALAAGNGQRQGGGVELCRGVGRHGDSGLVKGLVDGLFAGGV